MSTRLDPTHVSRRPMSFKNIYFDYLLKVLRFFWVIARTGQVKLFCRQKRGRNWRVLKILIFSVALKSKGIEEVFNFPEFSSLDKILRITSYEY